MGQDGRICSLILGVKGLTENCSNSNNLYSVWIDSDYERFAGRGA